MDPLTVFGALAVGAMLVFYALGVAFGRWRRVVDRGRAVGTARWRRGTRWS